MLPIDTNLLLYAYREAAREHFIVRFPEEPKPQAVWHFPTLDCGGDFLTEPASLRPEVDAILQHSDS